MLGDADATRRSQGMDPRRDVGPITQNGVVGQEHIAKVNSDAQPKLSVVFQTGLQFARAADRIEHAMEAAESAVADLTDEAAVESGQKRAQLRSMVRDRLHALLLVPAHDGRVANHV